MFVQQEALSKDEYNHVLEGLSVENKKFKPFSPVEEITFTLRDVEHALKGVLVGYLFYGSFMIDILLIDEPYRKKGFGSLLVKAAENFAKQKKLSFLSVDTMGFWKAIPFYEKHGFKVDSVREGYQHGEKSFHLRKYL